MSPKEALATELRVTTLRILLGLLATAAAAGGSTYLAMRDQLVRNEEWAKQVIVQLDKQNQKLDTIDSRFNGLSGQLSESNQRLSRVEGVLSVRGERYGYDDSPRGAAR